MEFQSWILTARNAGEIAVSGSLQEKRVLAQKVFGSNLVLDCKIARGSCVKPWSLLVESNQTGGLERVKGIEPSSQPWEGHILPLNHTRFAGHLFCSKRHPHWQLVCSRALNHFQSPDGFGQFFLNQFQPLRRDDFPIVHIADVKTVNRRTAFRHDACGGNIQIQFGQCL